MSSEEVKPIKEQKQEQEQEQLQEPEEFNSYYYCRPPEIYDEILEDGSKFTMKVLANICTGIKSGELIFTKTYIHDGLIWIIVIEGIKLEKPQK